MQVSNLRDRFQPCRRRGGGRRHFLPLRSQKTDYLVRFSDGSQERYQVNYSASIEAQGSGQRWHYRAHLSRQLSIYNRAGQRFDRTDVDRRVDVSRHASNDAMLSRSGLRDSAFEHGSSSLEDEFEEVFQRLTKTFTASIIADKRRVESHFRQMYQGLEAISEVD